MARSKRTYTLEEQLDFVGKRLTECTEEIKRLKEQKSALEKQVYDKQVEELLNIIKGSGKSIEEIKEMLTNN